MSSDSKRGKIKSVMKSVLNKRVNRFKFRNVQLKDGTLCTDPRLIQKHLNAEFQAWHDHKPMHPLAQYIQSHPTLWKDVEEQRCLPMRKERTVGTEEVTESTIKLFSAALLHPREACPDLFKDTREELHADITSAEFKEAIKVRSTNKSSGITGFSINILKMWDSDIIEHIFELLSAIWEERHIPESWKHKWVVLIPKVKAPQVPIDKLRPICLLETMRKVWTAIIKSKILKTLQRHNVLQSTQAGFRPGYSTETSLLQFINILEQAEQYHSPLYYVSFDISKAFDRPPKNILKLGWARVGVPADIINWLVDMDVGGRAYIKSPWAQSHLDEQRLYRKPYPTAIPKSNVR